jgi:hypothetical protein
MKLRAKIKQPNLGEKQKGHHQKQNADPMESIHFCVIVPAAGRRRCRVQASNVVMYGHKHSGGKTIMAAQIIIEVRRGPRQPALRLQALSHCHTAGFTKFSCKVLNQTVAGQPIDPTSYLPQNPANRNVPSSHAISSSQFGPVRIGGRASGQMHPLAADMHQTTRF